MKFLYPRSMILYFFCSWTMLETPLYHPHKGLSNYQIFAESAAYSHKLSCLCKNYSDNPGMLDIGYMSFDVWNMEFLWRLNFPNVVFKVKKAMFLGASAIIILTLNHWVFRKVCINPCHSFYRNSFPLLLGKSRKYLYPHHRG